MSQIEVLQELNLQSGLVLLQDNVEFPSNPKIGTIIVKDQCLFAYIKIGGMETWYPFASKTSSYVHTQAVASLTWVVNHGLQTTDVWTQVKDPQGNVLNATVNVIDANTIHIVFTSARAGTAVVVAPQSIDVPEVKAVSIKVDDTVIIDSSGIRVNGQYVLTSANIDQQINDALTTKADITYVDTQLAGKADKTTTYTKTEVDTAISKISGGVAPQGYSTINELATQLQFDETQIAQLQTDVSDIQTNTVTTSQLGVASGVATLGTDGKIPSGQLPSYVDDVVEYTNLAAFPATGETGKIYVALDTNLTYRWSGSTYIRIADGDVTSVNGYKGVVVLGKSDVGLGNVENKDSATIRGEITSSNVTTALGYTPVASNSTITGSTATKITYDNKGLVTAGSSLTAGDIPDLSTVYQSKNVELTGIAAITGTSGLVKRNSAGNYTLDTNTYLTGNQSITVSGDATGSGTTAIALTLANSGVTAGTYTKVVVDAKGRVTGSATLQATDIPALDASKITSGTLTVDTSGNAGTATKLATTHTIGMTGDVTWTSAAFDGSGNVTGTATLANSGATAGTYGSATQIPTITVDAKGRITSVSNTAVSIPSGSLTFTGDVTGSGNTGSSTALTLANSGVTAGTYKSVTVDAKGRVTAGTNPTTLAGYGITDAQSALVSGTNIKTINGSSVLGSGDIATLQLGSSLPNSLGTASAGSSTTAAKSDHVHAMPTAANVGAIATSLVNAASGVLGLDSLKRAVFPAGTQFRVATFSGSGTVTLDLSSADVFVGTITAATTFGFSNAPSTSQGQCTILRITNGGSYVIGWPAGTKFIGGNSTLGLTVSGTDLIPVYYDASIASYVVGKPWLDIK